MMDHTPRPGRWVAASLLFLVLLAGSVHAAASDTRARAPRAAGITLSIDDVKVVEDEGDVEAFFTVTLSAPSASPVSVHYETRDGTATAADDDYAPTSGILTIPTNMLTGTITVTVIGDATFEGDETYTVDLSNLIGASIDDGQGLGTISNNDPTPASLDRQRHGQRGRLRRHRRGFPRDAQQRERRPGVVRLSDGRRYRDSGRQRLRRRIGHGHHSRHDAVRADHRASERRSGFRAHRELPAPAVESDGRVPRERYGDRNDHERRHFASDPDRRRGGERGTTSEAPASCSRSASRTRSIKW